MSSIEFSTIDLISTSDVIVKLLHDKLSAVETTFADDTTDVDALTYIGSLVGRADLILKAAVESIRNKKRELLVLLETEGGYIESVEKIVGIFRHHYKRVHFLVADQAMSAGTVLALSGDSIHMDYSSCLGPIDPQIQRPGGDFIPAQGYLAQYQRLLERAKNGDITSAELHILIHQFDQSEIYKFEQSVELSVTLLKDWLVRYKFKDWKKTETQGKRVSKKMKEERAVEIARELNNVDRWHTHGRGIPMRVLRNDLNLKIDDFGEKESLRDAVRSYLLLLNDYMLRERKSTAVHAKGVYLAV